MNIVADENVERQIVQRLRDSGYQVIYVAEPGLNDDAFFALANSKNSILLTADKDFGEIAYRQSKI